MGVELPLILSGPIRKFLNFLAYAKNVLFFLRTRSYFIELELKCFCPLLHNKTPLVGLL